VLVLVACVGCSGDPGVSPDAPRGVDAPSGGDASGSPVPRNGLVAEWLFSGDASDTSGNNHVATVHGATLVADRFGRATSAYHFDGTSQSIEIADAMDLALTGDATFSAWIKPAAFTRLAGILSKYQLSGENSYTLRLGFNSPYSYYDFDNDVVGIQAPPPQVTLGQWQHVAAVVTGGTVTVYVNGAAGTPRTTGYAVQPTPHSLYIGVDFSTRFFTGAIDDVRLYSRVLQPYEILALDNEQP
jgi:hypothetical protein